MTNRSSALVMLPKLLVAGILLKQIRPKHIAAARSYSYWVLLIKSVLLLPIIISTAVFAATSVVVLVVLILYGQDKVLHVCVVLLLLLVDLLRFDDAGGGLEAVVFLACISAEVSTLLNTPTVFNGEQDVPGRLLSSVR